MTENQTPRLIQRLLDARRWPGNVQQVELVETHISWVLLGGEWAMKIKKPVELGFLDFSTLERRRRYCSEEVRINRRTAGDYYIGVVEITGRGDDLEIGGEGPVLECAVWMRRFPDRLLLDERQDLLDEALVEALAEQVAELHLRAEKARPDSDYGTPAVILDPVEDNFHHIRQLSHRDDVIQALDRLEAWSRRRWEQLRPVFEERKGTGWIRECHGDLHLGNIAVVQGRPLIFDAIEFSETLRWVDTMSDIAFLTMDLQEKGHAAWAWQLLNAYLERTGDYQGLRLLRFYQVYRAMVRAKVAVIGLQQHQGEEAQSERHRLELERYLASAEAFCSTEENLLLITHGLSGSGKSYWSKRICRTLPAIRLRSDVERKRLAFGAGDSDSAGGAEQRALYGREMSDATYGHLLGLSKLLLQEGFSVCVDAAFLYRRQRASFMELTRSLQLGLVILVFEAAEELLRLRLDARAREGADPSDADVRVLEKQLQVIEPLTEAELRLGRRVAVAAEEDVGGLRTRILGRRAA